VTTLRKTLTVSACLLTTVALLLAGTPARAGELNIADPAGDATGLDLTGDGELESTPRPSDGALDILGLRYSSTPTELRIDLKMAKIAMPEGGVGYSYRVNFTHSDVNYHFLYQVLEVPGLVPVTFALRAGSTVIECRCSGKVNGKTATLEIKAEIQSLSRALKGHNAASAPIGPGTKFSNLYGSADRILGFLVAADYARAAPGAVFTF
jgi:hypothetical protein